MALRWLAAAAAVAVMAAASACTMSQAPAPVPEAVQPAATAGGACRMLDFAVLERLLGTRYAVAAAAGEETTQTCVVRTGSSPLPQVTLSVAPSIADAAVFRATVQPKSSTVVDGLGKAAYRATLPPADETGPALEIGWLSGNAHLLWLRVTLPTGADPGDLGLRLVVLAKEIDKLKPPPAPSRSPSPSATISPTEG